MKQYKTLGVVKTYQVHEFVYDKIGMEDTYPADMHDDKCYDDLYARVDAQARRKYPHLYVNGTSKNSAWDVGRFQVEAPPMTPLPGAPPTLEEQMRSSTHLKTLEIYFPIIDKMKDKEERKRLFLIYDEMHDKLKNKSLA